MIARVGARRLRTKAVALSIVIAMLTVSCGHKQDILEGSEPTQNGELLKVSSLEPWCGCMTLNVRTEAPVDPHDPEPDPEKKKRYVEVVARLYDMEIGSKVLEYGNGQRARFDWAGSGMKDAYTLAAFKWNPIDKRGAGLVPFSTYVYVSGEIKQTPCNDEVCTVGTLGMNKASEAPIGQDQVNAHQLGVNFARGDQVIEINARPGFCGCMLVRSDMDIELRSELHGVSLGSLVLKQGQGEVIGFDWAGTGDSDLYTLTAFEPERPAPSVSPPAGAAAVPWSTKPQETRISMREHLTIVGQMTEIRPCDATAVPSGPSLVLQTGLPPLTCPWTKLGMNAAVKTAAPTSVASSSPPGGQTTTTTSAPSTTTTTTTTSAAPAPATPPQNGRGRGMQ